MKCIISIKPEEYYDDKLERFVYSELATLTFNHSLLNIAKWESIHHKSFFEKKVVKSDEEILSYIKCMVEDNPEFDPKTLSKENIETLNSYMNDSMTATVINSNSKGNKERFITSELLYAWMAMLHIPSDYENWHINRLITLINVINEEQSPPNKKKKPMKDIFKEHADNEARNRAWLEKKRKEYEASLDNK